MKICKKGYKYKDFKLGQIVIHDGVKTKIIGFDKNDPKKFLIIQAKTNKYLDVNEEFLVDSICATHIWKKESDSCYRFVSPKEIQTIKDNTVLGNTKYAFHIDNSI